MRGPARGPAGAEPRKRDPPLDRDASWILEITAATFEKEVIERSLETPVLVYFTATWCGPCKTLSPALERRATEGAGRFVLAKVDLDKNPDLAQAFRVQAVPTVLAIAGGQMVDGFQGLLPEEELDAFLDKLAPGGDAPTGVTGEARELAAKGDHEAGVELLRAHLLAEPGDTEASLCLAELLLDGERTADARLLFDELDEATRESEAGRAISARLAFADSAGDLADLQAAVSARPDDVAARTSLGRAHIARQEYEQGLEHLLEVVRSADADEETRGEAKQAMLEVFDILGLEDPVANDYRFKLSLELFA